MTMGAFYGNPVLKPDGGGKMSGQTQLILAILISTATGAAAFFHAYAAINMKADQTISGTALNMFAPAFAIFVARVIQGCSRFSSTTPSGLSRSRCWEKFRFGAAAVPEHLHYHVLRHPDSGGVHTGAVPDPLRAQTAFLRRAPTGGGRGGNQCVPDAVRGRADLRACWADSAAGVRGSHLHQLQRGRGRLLDFWHWRF